MHMKNGKANLKRSRMTSIIDRVLILCFSIAFCAVELSENALGMQKEKEKKKKKDKDKEFKDFSASDQDLSEPKKELKKPVPQKSKEKSSTKSKKKKSPKKGFLNSAKEKLGSAWNFVKTTVKEHPYITATTLLALGLLYGYSSYSSGSRLAGPPPPLPFPNFPGMTMKDLGYEYSIQQISESLDNSIVGKNMMNHLLGYSEEKLNRLLEAELLVTKVKDPFQVASLKTSFENIVKRVTQERLERHQKQEKERIANERLQNFKNAGYLYRIEEIENAFTDLNSYFGFFSSSKSKEIVEQLKKNPKLISNIAEAEIQFFEIDNPEIQEGLRVRAKQIEDNLREALKADQHSKQKANDELISEQEKNTLESQQKLVKNLLASKGYGFNTSEIYDAFTDTSWFTTNHFLYKRRREAASKMKLHELDNLVEYEIKVRRLDNNDANTLREKMRIVKDLVSAEQEQQRIADEKEKLSKAEKSFTENRVKLLSAQGYTNGLGISEFYTAFQKPLEESSEARRIFSELSRDRLEKLYNQELALMNESSLPNKENLIQNIHDQYAVLKENLEKILRYKEALKDVGLRYSFEEIYAALANPSSSNDAELKKAYIFSLPQEKIAQLIELARRHTHNPSEIAKNYQSITDILSKGRKAFMTKELLKKLALSYGVEDFYKALLDPVTHESIYASLNSAPTSTIRKLVEDYKRVLQDVQDPEAYDLGEKARVLLQRAENDRHVRDTFGHTFAHLYQTFYNAPARNNAVRAYHIQKPLAVLDTIANLTKKGVPALDSLVEEQLARIKANLTKEKRQALQQEIGKNSVNYPINDLIYSPDPNIRYYVDNVLDAKTLDKLIFLEKELYKTFDLPPPYTEGDLGQLRNKVASRSLPKLPSSERLSPVEKKPSLQDIKNRFAKGQR